MRLSRWQTWPACPARWSTSPSPSPYPSPKPSPSPSPSPNLDPYPNPNPIPNPNLEQVVAKGGRFLEAPVSGSKGPAAAGALVFLCGGDKPLFEQVSAELEAMGKARWVPY